MALFRKKSEDMPPEIPGIPPMPSSSELLAQRQGAGLRTGAPPEIAEPMPLPPPPPPPVASFSPATLRKPKEIVKENIEEISEAIISEKWKTVKDSLNKLDTFKEDTRTHIDKLHENFLMLDKKMDLMEKAIFGKVEEYSKGISDVNVELKAMQKVFKTMLPEFTANIKELRRLVTKAKKK